MAASRPDRGAPVPRPGSRSNRHGPMARRSVSAAIVPTGPAGRERGPRIRPGAVRWQREMIRLEAVHREHGYVPEPELVAAARRLGVTPPTVRQRLAESVRAAARRQPVRLSVADQATVGGCRDFAAAIACLRARGHRAVSSFALERALWQAPGLTLSALRRRERTRRATLAPAAAGAAA